MPPRASNPATSKDELALRQHRTYRGKVQMMPKCPLRSFDDFAIWYTPGVAAASRAIGAERERVWELTNRGNTVAIVSDGSRVLGLGNIGPEAAMPVMEGKALLFKYLGGVDAVPISRRERSPGYHLHRARLEPLAKGQAVTARERSYFCGLGRFAELPVRSWDRWA